jgi:hypothetical protein
VIIESPDHSSSGHRATFAFRIGASYTFTQLSVAPNLGDKSTSVEVYVAPIEFRRLWSLLLRHCRGIEMAHRCISIGVVVSPTQGVRRLVSYAFELGGYTSFMVLTLA